MKTRGQRSTRISQLPPDAVAWRAGTQLLDIDVHPHRRAVLLSEGYPGCERPRISVRYLDGAGEVAAAIHPAHFVLRSSRASWREVPWHGPPARGRDVVAALRAILPYVRDTPPGQLGRAMREGLPLEWICDRVLTFEGRRLFYSLRSALVRTPSVALGARWLALEGPGGRHNYATALAAREALAQDRLRPAYARSG